MLLIIAVVFQESNGTQTIHRRDLNTIVHISASVQVTINKNTMIKKAEFNSTSKATFRLKKADGASFELAELDVALDFIVVLSAASLGNAT